MKELVGKREIDYRALFESVPGLFLILEPNVPFFTILGASDAYLQATLTKRNEIVERGLFEVFPDNPDDLAATGTNNLRKSLERVLEKKAPDVMAVQKYDIPRPESEGGGFEERHWKPLNTPVLKNNKIVYIIHKVKDVTELVRLERRGKEQAEAVAVKLQENLLHIKKNEEKTKTSEILLQSSIENQRDTIILLIDKQYRYLNFNTAYKKNMEQAYKTNVAIGINLFDCITKEADQKKARINFDRALAGENHITIEEFGEAERYYYETRYCSIFNEKKEIIGASAFATNVTDRKKNEQELKKSNELFSTLFEHNPASIVVSRLEDAKIINVNEAFLSSFGFSSKKEVLGKTARELNIVARPEQREELTQLLKEKKIVKDFEIRAYTKQGDAFWISTSILKIEIESCPCLFSISVDISNRKKIEEELVVANKELEAFSYSVSHDLRAPLRAIHSYAKILEEDYGDKLNEDAKKIIDTIQRNSRIMGSLIDDLLSFARLGKKELVSADINMNSLTKAIARDFLATDIENKVNLSIQTLPPALGDSALIKQVLINLISNAIKFSGKKQKIIIDVGCMKKENKNVYYIKDNGVGFDMEYYSKLFGVFHRLHSQEEFEGTGVGLAVVQRIIHKHNGEVWAESTINEGATFYFSLPTINQQ